MIGVVVILLLVPFATWLVRRRPGPLHRGWLILLGVPLMAADAGETSQPDPGEAPPPAEGARVQSATGRGHAHGATNEARPTR